eukprot:jgi/Botrbrau1/19725/Bobra.0003s0085.1
MLPVPPAQTPGCAICHLSGQNRAIHLQIAGPLSWNRAKDDGAGVCLAHQSPETLPTWGPRAKMLTKGISRRRSSCPNAAPPAKPVYNVKKEASHCCSCVNERQSTSASTAEFCATPLDVGGLQEIEGAYPATQMTFSYEYRKEAGSLKPGLEVHLKSPWEHNQSSQDSLTRQAALEEQLASKETIFMSMETALSDAHDLIQAMQAKCEKAGKEASEMQKQLEDTKRLLEKERILVHSLQEELASTASSLKEANNRAAQSEEKACTALQSAVLIAAEHAYASAREKIAAMQDFECRNKHRKGQ